MRYKIITKPCLHFTSAAIFMVYLLYNDQYSVEQKSIHCYYSETGDALPSAEDPKFSPKAQSIYFHETSCRGGLTVRQACAVEAAARAHPKREIYVLFSAPVTNNKLETTCLAKLLRFPNVKFLRVHIAEYSKGTAVRKMLLHDVKHSRYNIQHTADILRILTLNKWGGIYLDTDMIVTRSLENLPPNFIAKESLTDIASAIMSFAKDVIGTYVTNSVIKVTSKEYDPDLWTYIGSEVIQFVLENMCPKVMKPPNPNKSISNCKGVMIFHEELFYPHSFSDFEDIFKPAPEIFDLNRPYTYHMYSHLSNNMTIRKGTIYDLVAKAFCPTIHTNYPDEFSAKSGLPRYTISTSSIHDIKEARDRTAKIVASDSPPRFVNSPCLFPFLYGEITLRAFKKRSVK